MICPKCEEGAIVKIRFKRDKKRAYLCEFCEALWFEGEIVNFRTGSTFDAYSQGEDLEYSVDESSEKDQDHQPVHYVDWR